MVVVNDKKIAYDRYILEGKKLEFYMKENKEEGEGNCFAVESLSGPTNSNSFFFLSPTMFWDLI